MNAQHGRADQPISTLKNDRLDRSSLVDSITNTLVRREPDKDGNPVPSATGLVVGLTGPWGSGKSSLLNLVHEKLSTESQTISVRFNPWIFKDREELLDRLFEAIRTAMGRSNSEEVRSLVEDLERYWRAIGPVATTSADALLPGWRQYFVARFSYAASAFIREITNSPRPDIIEAKRRLERRIEKAKLAVVVLVDELDRVEDVEVREVAKLIKAIGDLKGVSYLVAYDPERVAQALGNGDRDRGEAYLEKIIHHAIPLRPLFESDIDQLLDPLLRGPNGDAFPMPNERQTKILAVLKQSIKTPREIVRLEGAFTVLSNAVNEEVCRYDLLAYCWIMTKAPSLQKLIAERYERLVDDPSAVEFSRRIRLEVGKETMVIDKEIGVEATQYSELLTLLFPSLGTKQREDNNDRSRLCVRSNIRRVLYLGYPPDVLRRDTVVRIWTTASFDELTAHTKSPLIESLPVLFERLEDLMQTLDEGSDETFWMALSQALKRPVEWGSGREALRDRAEQVAALLSKFANSNPQCRERGQKILAALRSSGDLAIMPIVVRNHISRFGKQKGGKPRLDRLRIWDESDFDGILRAELDRYREYICGDDFLVNAFSFETAFALLSMGRYGDLERSSMTNRLVDVYAASSFAALIIPPGHTVEPGTLAEVIDVAVFRERAATFGHQDTWALDDYRNLSARRLIALANGRDPMWLEDDDDLASPAQEPG